VEGKGVVVEVLRRLGHLIAGLVAHQRPRVGQKLGAQRDREDPADEEGKQHRHHVHQPDALVVEGQQPRHHAALVGDVVAWFFDRPAEHVGHAGLIDRGHNSPHGRP
jgi:hypothetical protein